MSALKELAAGRELLTNLTLRELRGKYKRTALGWAWSMLNPLSTIVIYSIVFGKLFGLTAQVGNPSGLDSFTFFLTSALLAWNFTSTGISATIGTLVGNANLIKKVYFPREYIVASSVFSWVVSFLIELAVLAVILTVTRHMVLQWLPVVLVLVFFQCLLVLGYSLALAPLNVYFRDVTHFVGIFMQIWFYLTPVVYPIIATDKDGKVVKTYIPGHINLFFWHDFPLRFVYKLNPMVHYVTAYRNLLYDGRMPGASSMAYLVGLTLVVLVFGWMVFRRLEARLVEEL